MKFYKITPKNLMIDSLVLALCAFSHYNARTVAKASIDGTSIGLAELYWIILAVGVFLVRWSYLAWSCFYGEKSNKSPSLVFKIQKVLMTCGAVVGLVSCFIFIFIFLL